MLREEGHEVFDVRDSDRLDRRDEWVFEFAQQHAAILLTTDRDFFHTVPHLYPFHYGAVVFALTQPNRSSILKKLAWFLERFSNRSMQNTVIQLRDNTYAILGPEGGSGGRVENPPFVSQ